MRKSNQFASLNKKLDQLGERINEINTEADIEHITALKDERSRLQLEIDQFREETEGIENKELLRERVERAYHDIDKKMNAIFE